MSRLPYFSGVLAALLLTFAACDTEPTPAGTLHTDSASVPVATAVTPLWGPGEGWTVADGPEVEIGSVDGLPEYQFADVVAAVRLDNGNIVVADRGASELRSYDADGSFQWRVGREGEGPGEFLSLDFLGRMAGDSLVAYDGRLLRVQVIDPGGGVVRTLPALAPELTTTAGSAPDKAVGVLDGRLIVRFIDLGVGTPSGIVRWPNERLVALDLASGAATSLLLVPGPEAMVEWRAEDHYTHGSYVFGKGPEYGAAAGRLALIDTEAYAVRIVSPADGSLLGIVRRDVQPIEATEEVFRSLLDGVVEEVFGNPEEAAPEQVDLLTRMWTERPRAPYLPVLRSVHVDATGSLWVTPHYLAGADPPPFEVFAADGLWLGRVSLPAGLDRGFIQYGAPELEIGTDYVLGVWTDELDVQYVRMYRLDR
ncbi:MAG: hypothetical protein F4187_05265 [Gemmatimonadetes bacterium]|nr:hypothetical protein [Gemmatimonadota bacterium]